MVHSTKKLIYQFKITLLEISTPIWRRIQVPEPYTFWDLHVAIQDSLGWLDCHLHAFDLERYEGDRAVEIGIPDDETQDVRTIAGWKVAIADHFIRPGMSIPYRYDFGDGWIHDVVLEGTLVGEPKRKYPQCIAGERACPPEDCGGTGGYCRLLEVLRTAGHPEHPETVAWLKGHARNYHPYDPEYFDPQAVRFSDPEKRWKRAFAESRRK